MELTNGLNKRVVEIYKGGELVWEMPLVMVKVAARKGRKGITVDAYPASANVQIFLNNNLLGELSDFSVGGKTLLIQEILKEGDAVKVIATHTGWKTKEFKQYVY